MTSMHCIFCLMLVYTENVELPAPAAFADQQGWGSLGECRRGGPPRCSPALAVRDASVCAVGVGPLHGCFEPMEVMDAGQKRERSVSSVRTPPVSSRTHVDFDALLDRGFILNGCPASLGHPDLTGMRGKNAVDFKKPIFFTPKD